MSPASSGRAQGVTAYQQIHRHAAASLRAGSLVLVHGAAGGTGAMLCALARLHKCRVVATCSARNIAAVKAAGDCVAVIDYATDWAKAARDAAAGAGSPAGFDAVFDAFVAKGYLSKGLRLLARGGMYIAYGFTDSSSPGAIALPSAALCLGRIALQNALFRLFDGKRAAFTNVANDRDGDPASFGDDLRALVALAKGGQLRPEVGRVWEFGDAKNALLAIEAGGHRGKQVVRVGPKPE